MGIEPGIDGKTRIEIDEFKVIKLGQNTRWIFGMVDRNKYDIRISFNRKIWNFDINNKK